MFLIKGALREVQFGSIFLETNYCTLLAVMGSELSYLLLILLSAEYDEEYEEAEDKDYEAEEDGSHEAEDDVTLCCEAGGAWRRV